MNTLFKKKIRVILKSKIKRDDLLLIILVSMWKVRCYYYMIEAKEIVKVNTRY
jgi:hypothetical protein